MARGGKRQGAGRKVNQLTKRTREIAIQSVVEGETPLEFLISVMRNSSHKMEMRLDAAKAAATYVHPKLANVQHGGDGKNPIELRSSVEVTIVDSETPSPARIPSFTQSRPI